MFGYKKSWAFGKAQYGYGLYVRGGWFFGFDWMFSNEGRSNHTAAIVTHHPPQSITWTLGVYWSKPTKKNWWKLWRSKYGRGGGVTIPLIGHIHWSTQEPMYRKDQHND